MTVKRHDHVSYIITTDDAFGSNINKCAVVNIQRGKILHKEAINLPNEETIKERGERGCKYLGVLQD